MTTLSGYRQINIHQIEPHYGCTPWAIEWLVRYKGVNQNVWEIPSGDLDFFQYRFNLHEQTDGDIQNTFLNILELIREFYPNVGLVHCNTYRNNQGPQKYQRIRQLISQGVPCITSIRLLPQNNAHVVPVVRINPNDVEVIWSISPSGVQNVQPIRKSSLFQMHSAGRGKEFMCLP